MTYAIISDVHANETALRHVLEAAAAQGAERIVCLGDVVGYGPQPAEALALVRSSVAVTLRGNHDAAVSGCQSTDDFIGLAADAVKRHREALKAEDLAWLKGLPHTCELDGALAAHGDFTDPSLYNYVDDEESAARNFAVTDAQLMFVGHTHVPGFFLTGRSGAVYRMEPQDFALEDGKRYIVNPGSVGFPRENDGTCLSSYVLYDSTARTVSFHFVPFAVSSMIQRGPGLRRRSGRMAVIAAVLVFVAVCVGLWLCQRQVPADDALVLKRERIVFDSGWRHVSANLKVDRKGDPVVLCLEFRTATGALMGKPYRTLVKGSSATWLKIPDGACSADFVILRESASSRPQVLSFGPMAR